MLRHIQTILMISMLLTAAPMTMGQEIFTDVEAFNQIVYSTLINFDMEPDGTPIADDVIIDNQYQSLGVSFGSFNGGVPRTESANGQVSIPNSMKTVVTTGGGGGFEATLLSPVEAIGMYFSDLEDESIFGMTTMELFDSTDNSIGFYNLQDEAGTSPGGSLFFGVVMETTIKRIQVSIGAFDYVAFDNLQYGNLGSTISSEYVCSPNFGTVPFATTMTLTLNNDFTEQARTIAGHIDATLASGGFFPNWRAGHTNVAAGDSFVLSWNQTIPALGSLVGDNSFFIVAQDVTPAPYNQPPYPPAGNTGTASCTVTGNAP